MPKIIESSYNLYIGKVISIDDPEKKGNAQIKFLPEMKDVSDNDCPWISPFSGNSSDNELQNHLPEVGSLIWCLADKEFYSKYYTDCKYNIKGKFNYSKISLLLGSIIGLNSDYKNIQFTLYEDGALSFHNRSDGSHGYIQKSGTYMIMDNAGVIQLNGNTKSLVTHAELDIALQLMVTAINATFATKADTGGAPGTITINIANSATTKVKTG